MRLPLLLVAAIPLAPAAAVAQFAPLLPASYSAPNYDRVFVGVNEAHEAGAYLARARGPAAAWYNVAGLAAEEGSSISANARGLELAFLSTSAPGGTTPQVSSFEVIPQFVGAVLGREVLPWESVRIGLSFTKQISWDSLVWWGGTSDVGHWNSVSDSSFSSFLVAGSAAWAVSPELRLGASLGISWTHLFENDRFSSMMPVAGQDTATQRSRLLSGLVFDLAPTVAVQWAPRPWLALGAVVRLPPVRIGGWATLQVSELDASGGVITDTSIQDPSAQFDYRMPLEVDGAAAFTFERWELEVDVRFHAAPGTYQMLGSSQPVQTTTIPPGGPPVASAFVPIDYLGQAIVDVAVGGSYAVAEHYRIHAGLYNSQSPVSSAMTVMRRMDLYGVRAGVSFTGAHLTGSIGLGLERGRSGASPGLTFPGVGPVDDAIQVTTLNGVVGLEYRF